MEVAAPARRGIETCDGDVTDRVSMREGMAGADWVIHAAADLDFHAAGSACGASTSTAPTTWRRWPTSSAAAVSCLLSSIAAFTGSPADGSAATEETPKGDDFPSLYSATKRAGEEAVRAWAAKGGGGLALNVVWPSLVYGPPGKKAGANALLRMLAKGRLPVLVGADRRTSWVHVDDLVDGLVRVIERAEPGRDYLMTGDVATVRSVVERTCELAGTRPPRLALPLWLARLGLAAAAPYYRLRGFKPPLPPASSTASAATGPSTTPAPATSSTGTRGLWRRGCPRRSSTFSGGRASASGVGSRRVGIARFEEHVEPGSTIPRAVVAGGVRFGRESIPTPISLLGFPDRTKRRFDTEII